MKNEAVQNPKKCPWRCARNVTSYSEDQAIQDEKINKSLHVGLCIASMISKLKEEEYTDTQIKAKFEDDHRRLKYGSLGHFLA